MRMDEGICRNQIDNLWMHISTQLKAISSYLQMRKWHEYTETKNKSVDAHLNSTQCGKQLFTYEL